MRIRNYNTMNDPYACTSCGMPDPCGFHFADCELLEVGDFIVAVEYRGTQNWTREDVGLPYYGKDTELCKCGHAERWHDNAICEACETLDDAHHHLYTPEDETDWFAAQAAKDTE